MNKEEITMLGFEIVAYAGDARSKLLDALKQAEAGDFEAADQLVEDANKILAEAHNKQTEMLAKEASGENIELGIIMIHGQDHLMTTVLLKDLIHHLINIYKKK